MVTRPVRERPAEQIKELSAAALDATGYSELSLLSLSSSDHSEIEQIVRDAAEEYCADGIAVALPSLRIESFSVALADAIKEGRRSGFTFAPEAATERLRRVINKVIPDERLLATADAVYARGWRTIKLYFMIGLPTETDEDVTAICNLARRVLMVGRTAQFSRLAVRPSARRRGIATALLEMADGETRAAGGRRLVLHAQTYAQQLYDQAGYAPRGRPFREAGIEHIAMEKELS